MITPRTLAKIGSLASLLVLTSCASISVQPGHEYATPQMPQKIYVMLFGTGHAEFNVDREGAELKTFKRDLQHVLQAAQIADLSNRLVAAAPAPKHPWDRRENGWVVTGEFVKVNQGSRFLRTAIGFGAGGTKVEAKVAVYDLSAADHRPFLVFSTTGGSNAEPGAVTSFATDPLDLAVQIAPRPDRGHEEDGPRSDRGAFGLHVSQRLDSAGQVDSAQDAGKRLSLLDRPIKRLRTQSF
jgi:hypothetical protein